MTKYIPETYRQISIRKVVATYKKSIINYSQLVMKYGSLVEYLKIFSVML